MLRKSFCILLVLVLTVVSVSADILWEPYDNNYYNNAGYENFSYMNRTYVVPEGTTANLYKNPETGGLIKTCSAGTRLYIGPYAEINGEIWAAGYAYSDFENEGWVRLNRLQLEYSTEEFMKDYSEQISSEPAVFDTADLNGEIPSWTFPGSGIQQRILTFTGEAMGYNDGKLECTVVYTDPAGNRWGYVGYYMGRTGWIYLEDLYATEPPIQIYPQLASTVTDTAPEANPSGSMIWIAIPVAAVILATGTAIVLLRKKHTKQQ